MHVSLCGTGNLMLFVTCIIHLMLCVGIEWLWSSHWFWLYENWVLSLYVLDELCCPGYEISTTWVWKLWKSEYVNRRWWDDSTLCHQYTYSLITAMATAYFMRQLAEEHDEWSDAWSSSCSTAVDRASFEWLFSTSTGVLFTVCLKFSFPRSYFSLPFSLHSCSSYASLSSINSVASHFTEAAFSYSSVSVLVWPCVWLAVLPTSPSFVPPFNTKAAFSYCSFCVCATCLALSLTTCVANISSLCSTRSSECSLTFALNLDLLY